MPYDLPKSKNEETQSQKGPQLPASSPPLHSPSAEHEGLRRKGTLGFLVLGNDGKSDYTELPNGV